MIKQIKAALTKISKAGLAQIQAPFSLVRQQTAHNYSSVTTLDPERLATAFRQADTGYLRYQAELFELIEEQDSHIFGEMSKRRRAVTGLGWDLHPKDDATQAEIDRTKELKDMLCSIANLEDALYDLTDAIGKGYSCLEIEWGTGSVWLPKALNWVPQWMFRIDPVTNGLMLDKHGAAEVLREWGWIVHEHRAKSGYIESAALFRVLAWTYAYKAYDVTDMQKFLELYGLPIRLGKYPSGIGDKERNELIAGLRSLGHDGAGIVPSNMLIELVEAKGGKTQDFLDAVAYWEKKQSICILGSTLTSQADGKTSTNALGQVHNEVRREIMLHDVRQIEPTTSKQLVAPIALINGMFPADRLPLFKYDTAEAVDRKSVVETLATGAGIGLEIDVDWAHKELQIPRAGKDAKILTVSGKLAAPSPTGAALTRLAALAKQQQDSDIVGNFSQQLAALCMPQEQAAIQQIAAVVAAAGSFDDAIAGIEALNLDNKDWGGSLQLGMAAAHLAGRSDV